jgi:curved DNA-binding protein CbpA
MEFSWKPTKDPDFTRIVTIPLEGIFHGTERNIIVKRDIRRVDSRISETEEAKYTVVIEPGCADGQTFRFSEAGHENPVNIPADLIVEIRAEQHQVYERSGSDLIYRAKISLDNVCVILMIHFV